MFCHLPDSGRHVTNVFQGISLALALAFSRRGREGEDPGNEVETKTEMNIEQNFNDE